VRSPLDERGHHSIKEIGEIKYVSTYSTLLAVQYLKIIVHTCLAHFPAEMTTLQPPRRHQMQLLLFWRLVLALGKPLMAFKRPTLASIELLERGDLILFLGLLITGELLSTKLVKHSGIFGFYSVRRLWYDDHCTYMEKIKGAPPSRSTTILRQRYFRLRRSAIVTSRAGGWSLGRCDGVGTY
jgi:hypothetical protein